MRTGLALTLAFVVWAGWSPPVEGQPSGAVAPPPDSRPVPISQKVPEYPLLALARARNGEVVVEFTVTITGVVKGVRAVRSTDPVFEAPAVAAVSQWVFQPGRKAGRPVNTRLQVPIIFRPTDEQLAAFQGRPPPAGITLPFARQEETIPQLPADMVPVYPYEALLNNRHLAVAGEVEFDEQGEPGVLTWKKEPPPEFVGAVEAMLEAWRGTKIDGQLLTGRRRFAWRFDPHDGEVRVTDAGAAILKRLRLEGTNAIFATPDELDARPQPVSQPEPPFPRSLQGKQQQGEAEVEYFIDPSGRAQLPHVLTASDPAFGYAACQAVANWRFTIPIKDGRPVVVRARVPVEFKLK